LACVSKHYNQCAITFWKQFDLKPFCSELRILDAKTLGITVDDEPNINKLAILECYKNLTSHVDNDECFTLLTMPKGLTLNRLVKIAAQEGMRMDFTFGRILKELGDVPVEQTYVILITNSIFKGSQYKNYALHKECAAGHGCELPTVQEYVALCVFTSKVFKKYVYGQKPLSYGRSSTHVAGISLVVGGSYPARLNVSLGLEPGHSGAGGRRKV
jgi:hypothetical protein